MPHYSAQWGVGVTMAVKAFFVVSGFYMALVLSSGRYQSARQFYVSRALRLYPLHLAVLAIIVVGSWLSPTLNLTTYTGLRPWALFTSNPDRWWLGGVVAFMNATLIGSDALTALCVDAYTHQWSLVTAEGICPSTAFPLAQFLINAPMWSVGVEIVFYVLAPMLVPLRTRWLVTLILLAGLSRLGLVVSGYDAPPWNRSVSLFELVYFLLGILSYRLYRRPVMRSADRAFLGGAFAALIMLTFVAAPVASWVYIAMLVISLPYVFALTKDWRLDQAVGELTYPVYVVHFLVLGLLLDHASWVFTSGWVSLWIVLCSAVVIAFGWLGHLLVTGPMERVRRQVARPGRREYGTNGRLLSSTLPH